MRAKDKQWQFKPEAIENLPVAVRRVQLKNKLLPEYGERFNPMLRCIVRRTLSRVKPLGRLASIKLAGEGN